MHFHALVSSPLGPILLQADEVSLQGLYFADQRDCPRVPGVTPAQASVLKPAEGMLNGRPLRTLKALRPGSSGPQKDADPQKDAGPQKHAGLAAGAAADGRVAAQALQAAAAEASPGVLQLLQDGTPDGSLAVLQHTAAQLSA